CRGERDWIVMKCLDKDRNRRYETASALLQDLEHYLHHEPVRACPPSTWYRFRKFARRNKVALVVAPCLIVATLVAVSSIGWVVLEGRVRANQANLEAKAAPADLQ